MKLIALTFAILLLNAAVHGFGLQTKIADYVSTYTRTNDFSGCVLVRKNQTALFSDCYGMASFEFKVPNSTSTKFKIGSVSKQFTAAGILILEEQGKLKTSDPVTKHLPEYAEDKITIHHLLTHTSGVPDIYTLPNFRKISTRRLLLKEVTDEIFKTDLVAKPGANYAYSNSGYTILARVIEEVSGLPYGEFLNRHLFKPLRMNSTGDYFDQDVVNNLAAGYDPSGYDGVKRPDFTSDVFVRGSGSLYSTTGDIALWIDALDKGGILKEESRRKLFTNHRNNYGYGVSVYKSLDRNVFGHDGRISGYIADYLHYREDGISVIILGNIQTGVSDFFRSDIASIIFGKTYRSRAKSVAPKGSYPANVKSLAGQYRFSPGLTVYLDVFDGKLNARANEGSYSELVPLVDGRYFSRVLYSHIDFEYDEKNSPTKLIWINNDERRFEGVRVQGD